MNQTWIEKLSEDFLKMQRTTLVTQSLLNGRYPSRILEHALYQYFLTIVTSTTAKVYISHAPVILVDVETKEPIREHKQPISPDELRSEGIALAMKTYKIGSIGNLIMDLDKYTHIYIYSLFAHGNLVNPNTFEPIVLPMESRLLIRFAGLSAVSA